MSADPKQFRYFKFSKEASATLWEEYKLIKSSRDSIVKKFLDDLGASAYQIYHSDYIVPYWDKDFDFENNAVITKDEGDYISARGNGRFKAGKEFNQKIENAQSEVQRVLSELPSFGEFLRKKFKWGDRRFQIGNYLCGVSYYYIEGTVLLSAPVGCFSDLRTFEDGWSISDGEAYKLPENLEEITYGQFYDFTQK